MTSREQEIYNSVRHVYVITTKEVKGLFPDISEGMIYRLLSSLEDKGYLYRVKRGLYLVQKKPSDIPIIENPYGIALYLYSGYIGFSSALKVHGLIEYEPFTVFVITTDRSATMDLGNYTFKAVAMGDKAVGLTNFNGLYVSDTEKTFFDCFYKPRYGGGYSTVTKALLEIDMDWDKFIKYFQRFASASLCQRTGYVLDSIGEELAVPENVMDFFEGRICGKTKLLPSAPSRGRYSRKWKVLDNTVGEDKLGWYHGY